MFEINVSFKGKHLFATHERSITNLEKGKQLMQLLGKKFPTREGYAMELLERETSQQVIMAVEPKKVTA